MWTEEIPKQPGFYWLRYDDGDQVVVEISREDSMGLTIALPGNDDCYYPELRPTDTPAGRFWSEPLMPPA